MTGGALVVVGTGIKLASQCTPEAERAIKSADIVFAAADPIVIHWLQSLNGAIESLHSFYQEGRSRADTYELMTDAILSAVRDGKQTCAAFYGHPGVFVRPAHLAIARARLEGYEAVMLPGVSAEDCLCADLGVDPGFGLQSYEAHDFFVHGRKIDPSAGLVLWQLAVFGDSTFARLRADPKHLALLAEALMEIYPFDHEVVVYEAATLPVGAARIQRLPICDLAEALVTQQSTLYLPPVRLPVAITARLALLNGV